MYDPTRSDPINDRDHGADDTVVLCKAESFTPADVCNCEVPCCQTCGGPQVRVCDPYALPDEDPATECPLCDRVPHNNKPAALFEAGERPAFVSTGIEVVGVPGGGCEFDGCVAHEVHDDDATTTRIAPETMSEVVRK